MRFPAPRSHRPVTAMLLAAFLAFSGAAGAGDTGAASTAGRRSRSSRRCSTSCCSRRASRRSNTNRCSTRRGASRQRQQPASRKWRRRRRQLLPLPAAEAPDDWNFAWNNGFKLERNDGAFRLKFGGRIQLDGAVIMESNGLNDDLRALGGEGRGNGVEFRRARIFFEGDVYERLFFKAQYDFASGDPAFADVYMGLRDLGPLGDVQVGQFKEP